MKANKFVISGLNDPKDIRNIEQTILHSHEGINAVRVDMEASTVTVDYDEGRYTEEDIKSFVSHTGLNVIKVK
ncbi:MAG TPA: heavy-metal-associated domain-containing protein [Pseudobacteroides sp.]|uniref:heavy-metal-associated domain-containing protein n=1 Tax=Pseudobacteroides sp. TaxID=1968840 RepID=UPI002F95304E